MKRSNNSVAYPGGSAEPWCFVNSLPQLEGVENGEHTVFEQYFAPPNDDLDIQPNAEKYRHDTQTEAVGCETGGSRYILWTGKVQNHPWRRFRSSNVRSAHVSIILGRALLVGRRILNNRWGREKEAWIIRLEPARQRGSFLIIHGAMQQPDEYRHPMTDAAPRLIPSYGEEYYGNCPIGTSEYSVVLVFHAIATDVTSAAACAFSHFRVCLLYPRITPPSPGRICRSHSQGRTVVRSQDICGNLELSHVPRLGGRSRFPRKMKSYLLMDRPRELASADVQP